MKKIPKFLFVFSIILLHLNCILASQFQSPELPRNRPSMKSLKQTDSVQFYWIGHATVLIRLFDKWIITDPNFSTRTGVVVKRFVEPAINQFELEKFDAVLISHNHFDHLDQPTLKLFKGSGSVFMPEGGETYIPDGIFEKKIPVSESRWETYSVNGILITPVPVQHFGGRWLLDNLWDGEPYTGYIIRYKGVTIFFAGDTGYSREKFKAIGSSFQIDLAIIPIGPMSFLSARNLGNPVHVNPRGAIQIFKDTKASFMIPIHHSTFYNRGNSERELLESEMKDHSLKEKVFLIKQGECVKLDENKLATICQ